MSVEEELKKDHAEMQAAVDSKQKIIDAQVSPRYQGLQHFPGCLPACGRPAVQQGQLEHGETVWWVSEHQAAVGQTSPGCDLLSQHSHSYSCFPALELGR